MNAAFRQARQPIRETTIGAEEQYEYEKVNLLALDLDELVYSNVDARTAFRTAVAATTKVRSLGLDLGTLPESGDDLIGAVESGAKALLQADTIETKGRPDGVADLADDGIAQRRDLLVWLRALARTGHLERSALSGIPRRTGYLDVAQGLLAACNIFRTRWGDLENRLFPDLATRQRRVLRRQMGCAVALVSS